MWLKAMCIPPRSRALCALVEGQWRATGDKSRVHPETLYDNRFVKKAMKEIR